MWPRDKLLLRADQQIGGAVHGAEACMLSVCAALRLIGEGVLGMLTCQDFREYFIETYFALAWCFLSYSSFH